MKAFSKIYALTFVILSLLATAHAQSGGQPVANSQADLISDFDVNGLKVIVKRRPGAPSVSAGLFVRGGARNLTPQSAGIEYLTLSVATEASQKFPRAAMRKELTRMASSLGAGSNEDFSVVSLNSTRPNFDRTWEIFVDAVMNPSFTTEDFDLVRGRLLTGLRNASISPDSALAVLQDKVIYANHPYANDPNGTVETVGAFKLEDLRAYHKKIMQTSQLLLVVVGDVEPAVLQKRVADSLGKLPRGDYKEQPLPSLVFDKPSLDATNRAVETHYIKGVFAAPSLNNPDYYAMRVAMTILQSRVYNEVRIKRQLSYAPDASMEDDAANTANIYVTTNDANQSVTVMLNEIQDLQKNPVNADIFTNLPGYFLTTYFIKQETNASQVAELARYELIGGGWRNSLQFLDKIREVRPQDVQAVAQKYMKNIRFVVISPNGSAVNRQIFIPS
ncbi:MAG TPA: pitrilysin family protein [Pyrinomonadaceae bacterium]|jgi:predicted Zn-dependent peptidase